MLNLIHGDCLEEMKNISNKSVDMILCDLPYGTTVCKWDVVIPFDLLWIQYKRVIKDNGAIVLFGSEPFSSHLRMSNLKMYKYDWIWIKSNGGGFLNANKQPLKRHEHVHIFSKKQSIYIPQKTQGKAYTCISGSAGETTQDQSVSGWKTVNDGTRFPLAHQIFKSEVGLHPTQKPVSLLEYLIKTYTNENELVLDNCMGSGSTGVACKNLNRKFIGIEKEIKYFEIAQKRINE